MHHVELLGHVEPILAGPFAANVEQHPVGLFAGPGVTHHVELPEPVELNLAELFVVHVE